MKYRKKPIVIDADQWLPRSEKCRELASLVPGFVVHGDKLLIPTLEGTMSADDGDWIIRGVKGEYYPCKPEIFNLTYEKVEE